MAETGQYYKRPPGFRFKFGGMKTNDLPDAIGATKYPWAQNIRALRDESIRTRWGMTKLFPTSIVPAAIRAYSSLGTDNTPQLLAAGNTSTTTEVWLGGPADSSANIGSLAAPTSAGVAMIPFRPAQSPNPWMYVANGGDYQKFSAPSALTAIQQKVGIKEPATACQAAISNIFLNPIGSPNPGWAHGGVATSAINQNRITDTVQSVTPDPANPALNTIGVTATQIYTRFMQVVIAGNSFMVQDVFPSQPVPIGVAAITYTSGGTGHCVIVPQNMSPGPGTEGQSLYTQNLLGSLRRGSLIQFAPSGIIAIVWSVTTGPDGTICIETSTPGSVFVGNTFTQPAAIQAESSPTVGASITAPNVGFNLSGAGIGTQTSTVSIGTPFVDSLFSFQPDDYIHLSFVINTLSSLTEMKILFDVGDGTFLENFYYYTVRVSDIEAAVQNTLTQLGAAQLVSQRATIDEETAAASENQLATASGDQTPPGDEQWIDLIFPISSLTRVGDQQSQTLQNVNAIQYLFNVNAATDASIGQTTVFGGFSPDVGASGAPYIYRVRPRSSLTGAVGNPSPPMRYGVSPRREQVTVYLPSAAYDPQIDTWDIYRYGGTVTSFRWIGQTASFNATFLDNYTDDAALAGPALDFDNLEPWPSIDLPFSATALTVVGTTVLIELTNPGNLLRYLPGNEIRIGAVNVYTLRSRPTLQSGFVYMLDLEENAGAQGAASIFIYEPEMANQHLPYMWGPDAAGTVFACGDPARPGTLSFAKNYAPDNAPDSYNIEITPPSEPLLGGEILDGLSFVASTERWWALYPQPSNPSQRYSVIQQPLTRGLAAPFGHCNDGKTIYWWAKDGVWSSAQGSLTDADLSNLFPHDGVPGQAYTYNGMTLQPPDYGRASTFRLAYCNHYLYATYQDSVGTYHTLVLDLARGAWSLDVIGEGGVAATVYYQPEQQSGTLLGAAGTQYPLLVVGATTGQVYEQSDLTNDDTTLILSAIATFEWDGGDIRAGFEWGDLWAYLNPVAPAGVLVQPMSFGAPLGAATTIPTSPLLVQTPVSLGGEVLANYLGVFVTWSDNFDNQQSPTQLHAWQPSTIPKPETIADRITDWYDGGTEQAKYVQGFLLHADTFGGTKGLVARDADTLTAHAFTPAVVHQGESVKAYSFVAPFTAHQVRLEPTDQLPWRFFDVSWVFEPTPEAAETWQTQGTAFGLQGYMHVKQVSPCYASTTPITLTIRSYDGQSPTVITLPATGGAMQKAVFILTANKGQLYFFAATSSAPFQLFLESWEIEVGGWARQDNYLRYQNLGGSTGDQARV